MRLAVLTLVLLAGVQPPDVTTGVIDGKAALMVLPMTAERELIDPTGCEVHVVSDRGRGTESRVPCSEWFLPGPPGGYLMWLEQGATISGGPAVVLFDEVPFRGRGSISRHRMVPAGFVTLVAPREIKGVDSLRLITVQREGGLLPFERKVRIQDALAGRTVRMPEGSLLAGLYDKDGEALALARPVDVVAGEVVRVMPTPPPQGMGAVVFSLARRHVQETSAAVSLRGRGRSIVPDVVQQSRDRVVAIWYSVPGGLAELHFEGNGLPTDPIKIEITEGKITTVRRTLKTKGDNT